MSRLKAGLIAAALGLAVAGGVFAGFGLPGTLRAAESASRYTFRTPVGQLIHVGLGPFKAGGPREVFIVSVTLQGASPAIQLDSIRITRFDDTGSVPLGSDTGVREDIDKLPLALGTVLKPGQEGGFWITFRVNAEGQHAIRGLTVTYKSGWLTRTVEIGPGVTVRSGIVDTRGNGQGRGGGGGTGQPTPRRTR